MQARHLLPALLMVLAAAAAALAQTPQPAPAPATPAILGTPPTYSGRRPGTIPEGPLPNEAAIVQRIWSPGLDDGYVPQGLTFIEGALYVATYRSVERNISRGPCRLYRLDPVSGAVTGMLDLPPACGHAGGLARGGAGRLWVADTRALLEVAVDTPPTATLGRVVREVPLGGSLKGSLAAGTAEALWLGSYERDGTGRLWRIPHAAIGPGLDESAATRVLELPSRAQGAAFDADGRLWITRSGATLGELLRLDPASGAVLSRYQVPDGVEDLSFDGAGRLWTVSEAGARRWQGWATFFPVAFALDPARLR